MYIIIKVNLSNSKVMSRTNRDGSTLRNGKSRTYKSVYPSTQPSPATRNSPRETRNSGNQSTSSQPPSRATSGRKLPPNPIDLTGPTNEQQQQEENNNVLNTGTNNVNVQHNTEQTGNHSAEEGIDGAGNTVVPPNPNLNPNTTDAIPNQAQSLSPDEVDSNLTEYKKNVTKLSKCIHHLKFLEESLSEGTVPKGLKINLKVNAVNQSEQLNNNVQRIIERCQISVMEELKAHYIQTCAELETRIDQTKSTLACAPDETIITATYKEMETKVNSLNAKLDQRREKKKQGTSPPNVQSRRQYNRRTYQAPRQGNNPPYNHPHQFRPRRPEQDPPGYRPQEPFNRQQLPSYRNNRNFNRDDNNIRRPHLEQPPSHNNIAPPNNYPNQYWGNTNPPVQENQLGGLVNTLNWLLQSLQPQSTYQSFPQPPFPYRR